MVTTHPIRPERVRLNRMICWMVLLLGCGLVRGAQAMKKAADPPPVAGTEAVEIRVPTMRSLRKGTDDEVVQRIEFYRAKLPAKNRRRNNFAWAVADIPGLDKKEYFAHSGIQNLKKLSKGAKKKLKGISIRPKKGRFKALCVNQNDVIDGDNCWVRTVDTEYKILEDMAARLPDPDVKGHIRLYTDLPPCASCWNVMKQFLAAYPNIDMQVLHRKKRHR